jgi:hypothetical protein
MRKTIAAVAVALAALTACTSSGDDASGSKPAASSPAASGAPAADAPAALTAETAFARLAETVPSAKLGTVFTETNDPNKLLGRPGQYVSKLSFADSRIAADDVAGLKEGDTARGGGIEVFKTAEDAKKRADYIERVTEGVPMLAEYRYLNGPVLVRVSHLLTPSQAADYEKATASLS